MTWAIEKDLQTGAVSVSHGGKECAVLPEETGWVALSTAQHMQAHGAWEIFGWLMMGICLGCGALPGGKESKL